METHHVAEEMGRLGNLVGALGGLAGIGTALAAVIVAIWRHGYRAGKEAERRRQDRERLERLSQRQQES